MNMADMLDALLILPLNISFAICFLDSFIVFNCSKGSGFGSSILVSSVAQKI
jgi:ABC-type uncharacterized transport system permease subunit